MRLYVGQPANGTLYIGVTSNIAQRVWRHRAEVSEGFTKRYHVHRLVYAEFHDSMDAAIQREKQLKHWRRAWKLALIEGDNPEWEDLYPLFVPGAGPSLSRG